MIGNKFRGKRADNGKWIYGYLLVHYSSSSAYLQSAPHINYFDEKAEGYLEFEVIPESVGQFIGLLDKNKKEIYAGQKIIYEAREWTVKFGFHNTYFIAEYLQYDQAYGFYLESSKGIQDPIDPSTAGQCEIVEE